MPLSVLAGEFPFELNGKVDAQLYKRLTEVFSRLHQLEQAKSSPVVVDQQSLIKQLQLIGLLGPFGQNLLGLPAAPDPQLQNLTTGTVTSVAATSSASGFGLVATPAPIVGAGAIDFSITNAATARTTLGVQNLLLATTTLNLNTHTKQTLYTVPAAKSASILFVLLRSASVDLSAGVTTFLTFGFNAGASDWSPSSNFPTTNFTSSAIYQMQGVEASSGAAPVPFGTAAQTFGAITDAAFGSAATIVAEIYGTEF
jgi:hypothetical protein